MLKKIALPLTVAALLTAGLSGCVGGAQNLNAAGTNGDKSTPGDNGQNAGSACGIVLDQALSQLTKASSKGKVAVGFASKTDGGWYVAAPIGAKTINSAVVGLWATTSDPTSTDFDGTFVSLNDDARSATNLATAAASTFSATSDDAKKALDCETAAGQ